MTNRIKELYSGKLFDIVKPTPDQIELKDIAHSLSNICRFNGHCKEFYSVAQHSVVVASISPYEHKLAALMHDASEAYLCDLPTPIKRGVKLGKIYKEFEAKVEDVIADCFGFEYPYHESILYADSIALAAEALALMPSGGLGWDWPNWSADDLFKIKECSKIKCLTPCESKDLFLETFHDIAIGAFI